MAATDVDQDALVPSAAEREQLAKIAHLLENGPVQGAHLVLGEERVALPASLVRVMVQWLQAMQRREPAAPISEDQLLTTQQAANLLGVSTEYFVQLLQGGDIPYTRAGKRRRVRAGDLLAFKRRWDVERRAALDRLVELSEELGLYESTARPPKKWIRLDPAEVRSVERAARSRPSPSSDA